LHRKSFRRNFEKDFEDKRDYERKKRITRKNNRDGKHPIPDTWNKRGEDG
jgi:hypothetical protein